MALFSSFHPAPRYQRHRPRPQSVARVLGDHEVLRRLRGVQQVCRHRHAHSLPVEMIHLSETRSDQGTPMLVLACPYRGCNHREGWVIDFNTGRPRRLWGGVHQGS